MSTDLFDDLKVDDVVKLSEKEIAELKGYAAVIKVMIREAREKKIVTVKVDADIYKQQTLFKYFLMKDLIKALYDVESLGDMENAGFRVSMVDKKILDIHRKRRMDFIEENIMDPSKKFKRDTKDESEAIAHLFDYGD